MITDHTVYSKSQKIIYNDEKKCKKKIGLKFLSLYYSKAQIYQDCKKMNCYQFTLQINFSKDNLDA